MLECGKYIVKQSPVGLSFGTGSEASVNMEYEVLARRTETDDYVKFLPVSDRISDGAVVTVDRVDAKSLLLFVTSPDLVLDTSVPARSRFREHFYFIDPCSGSYYVSLGPVVATFMRSDREGFQMPVEECYVIHKDRMVRADSSFVEASDDVFVTVRIEGGCAFIMNGFSIVNGLYGSDQEVRIADFLFGRMDTWHIGLVHVIASIVVPWDKTLSLCNFGGYLEKYLRKNTRPQVFNGNPVSAVSYRANVMTVLTLLWGPAFAKYVMDDCHPIERVTFDYDSAARIYRPFDHDGKDMFEDFKELVSD